MNQGTEAVVVVSGQNRGLGIIGGPDQYCNLNRCVQNWNSGSREVPVASVFYGIADRSYEYDRTIGRGAFSGAGFRGHVDLALGPDGLIYVLNRGWEFRPDGVRVTMLNINEEFLGEFGSYGDAEGQFVWPSSIACDSKLNAYVSDDWLNRISIFDKDGTFLDKWGVPGTGDGQLNKPGRIRLDGNDNMYLVDSGNHRIQKFTKDGKFLAKWGSEGSGDGQFNHPWGLNIDSKGDVYVADWMNHRIQKFTPDGQFLAEFGRFGSEVGEFNHPTDVAVDKDGDIYVTDYGNNRVQVLTPDGRHVTSFLGDALMSKWGEDQLYANPDMVRQRKLIRTISREKLFWGPTAVAIDGEGRVIIIDINRQRLQIYRKENY